MMNDNDAVPAWLTKELETRNKPAMPPRRRAKPPPPTTTVDFNEPDLDDPDYLELLKIYEESDSDSEIQRDNFQRDRQRRKADSTPLLTQGAVYMLLIGCVGFFILFVNYYNVKQLDRLKQEYGLPDKNTEPEFWWKKSLMYKIYVQSYKDSDGDGIGDLMGIRQHVDHLHYLHIDAVILSPIFESPMVDQGRDVADFKAVHSKFGKMEDFEQLVEELHQLGIKIILEFVPNHTSKQHKWFRQSRKNAPNNPYKDYYIWHSGHKYLNGTLGPPSNWVSKYGGPAWTFDPERLEYYYHYYHESMPDLNHRDVKVRDELSTVYQFWLEKGVDGVLLDGVHALFETEEVTLDEPETEKEDTPDTHHASLDHLFTEDQPDVHEYLGTWRDVIEAHGLKHKKKIPLFVQVEDDIIGDLSKYYYTGADVPFTPVLTQIAKDCDGICVHDLVDAWISHVPTDNDVVWIMSSVDHGRVIQHRGNEYQNLFNMLTLLLPGITVSYYGEEIGMDHAAISIQETKDIMGKYITPKNNRLLTRDPGRTPMQWNSEKYAGFTKSEKPWLPVHPNYMDINVEKQKNEPTSSSSLQLYQRLATLRKYPSFQGGKIQYSIINDSIFSFLRYAKDNAPYLIILNIGNIPVADDYSLMAGVEYGKVVAHAKGKKSSPDIRDGEKCNLSRLRLEPAEGLVVLLVVD